MVRKTGFRALVLSYFMSALTETADRREREVKMFQTIGQIVVLAVLCLIAVITIDAIAHPEVTESRCNIKCAMSLHYLWRETEKIEMPDTGIPRQVLCSVREMIRRTVDGRKKSLEP